MPARSLSLFLCLAAIAGAGCDRSDRHGPLTNVSASAPDVDLPLPTFSLIDQHGQPFTSDGMKGSVYVVDFVFTSCPSICPTLTKKMSELVSRTAADKAIKFLSISVDPANDTPERMTAFLERNGQSSPRWSFVTGAPDVIDQTVVQGFKMRLDRDKAGTLAHGEHFVIVDKSLRIRGYFEATPEGLDALLERARSLAGA